MLQNTWMAETPAMTVLDSEGIVRFRSSPFPLLAIGVGGYFAYHLQTGDHGLEARAVLEKRKSPCLPASWPV